MILDVGTPKKRHTPSSYVATLKCIHTDNKANLSHGVITHKEKANLCLFVQVENIQLDQLEWKTAAERLGALKIELGTEDQTCGIPFSLLLGLLSRFVFTLASEPLCINESQRCRPSLLGVIMYCNLSLFVHVDCWLERKCTLLHERLERKGAREEWLEGNNRMSHWWVLNSVRGWAEHNWTLSCKQTHWHITTCLQMARVQ